MLQFHEKITHFFRFLRWDWKIKKGTTASIEILSGSSKNWIPKCDNARRSTKRFIFNDRYVYQTFEKKSNIWFGTVNIYFIFTQLAQFTQLERGNFDRGGKTAARNIEVTVSVIDLEGKNVENW